MNRRRFLETMGTTGAAAFTGGCTLGDVFGTNGTVVDTVEILNLDDSVQEFDVSLFHAGGSVAYETTVTLPGAPGNEYHEETRTDLPDVPVTEAEAAIQGDSIRKPVPDLDLSPYELTVMCNAAGTEVGITVFR